MKPEKILRAGKKERLLRGPDAGDQPLFPAHYSMVLHILCHNHGNKAISSVGGLANLGGNHALAEPHTPLPSRAPSAAE
jgi:hypothetical protein